MQSFKVTPDDIAKGERTPSGNPIARAILREAEERFWAKFGDRGVVELRHRGSGKLHKRYDIENSVAAWLGVFMEGKKVSPIFVNVVDDGVGDNNGYLEMGPALAAADETMIDQLEKG